MTTTETETFIREHGARVHATYGASYYNGWCAAYRRMAEVHDKAARDAAQKEHTA